jgi:uncharacterized protein YbjT (DUF2867 family)
MTTSNRKSDPLILVTGATGNVGRHLVARLRALNVRVRAVTRDAARAGFPSDVEIVQADPSQPDTVATALRGVTRVFVNPMATQSATERLLMLARKQGAERVVALSATNVDDDPMAQPSRMRGVNHQEVERALVESGLDWVALRTSLHATNSIPLWAAQLRAGDVVRGTYAASTAAPIHERDIADVVAHALLTGDLVGTRPVLTGPESLTQEQMVLAIGAALGRRVRYEEIPPDVAKRLMLERGFPFPPELIDRLHALLAKAVGHDAPTTREVEAILGRPASTYAQWAIDRADAFRAPS